jgi:NAD(P)H-hydrate epimerase
MESSIAVGAAGLRAPDLFIDAILGYSQRGDPRGAASAMVAATSGVRVLSLDVPTGLELERGIVGEPLIQAQRTLTLALPKEALRTPSARPFVGELYLGDISVPAGVYHRHGIPYRSPVSGGPIVPLT